MITTIAFDGDDTLWHHENYFSRAQDEFHAIMNGIGDYPAARELAGMQHINDLPLWGYGVKSFTLSMVEAAVAMTKGTIKGSDIKRILDIGRSLYQHPVILLDHVAETISALQGKYRLILITKGDMVAQEMKIAQSKLAPFFEVTEIVSEKDSESYRRVFHRNHVAAGEVVMVGNSIKSDILPPIHLGAQAIYIPYHTTAAHERADVQESDKAKFITLPSMKDLPALLAALKPGNLLSDLKIPAQAV